MRTKLDFLYDEYFSGAISYAGSKHLPWSMNRRNRRTSAKTLAGVCAALDITPAQLAAAYLDDLARRARREMDSEFNNRAAWAKTRASAEYSATPDFARYAVFGDLMPASVARKYKRLAGVEYDGIFATRELLHLARYAVDYGKKTNISEPRHFAPAFRQAAPGFEARDNGLYSSACRYTHYTYHAYFAAIESADKRHIWFGTGDGKRYLGVQNGRGSLLLRSGGHQIAYAAPWTKNTPKLTASQQCRAINKLIARRGLLGQYVAHATWHPSTHSNMHQYLEVCRDIVNEVVIYEVATGQDYHITGDPLRYTLSRAISAFHKRAVEKRQTERNAQLDQIAATMGDKIWVNVSDSVRAGNCAAGTMAMKQRIEQANNWGDIGAVTASELLAQRNDEYTRRAARAAVIRSIDAPANKRGDN